MKEETVVGGYKKAEVICVAVVTFGLWFLLSIGLSSPFGRTRFDQDGWLSAKSADSCKRAEMTDSLLRGRIAIGQPKDDILKLLGPADRDDGSELSYDLGACDFATLHFYFDGADKLSKREVRKH